MKTYLLTGLFVCLCLTSCKDQLEVVNPNQLTPESATTEQGIVSLAQGALYVNAFQETKFGGSYFVTVQGYHERLGDIISSPFSFHYLSCPDLITLDNGSQLNSINPTGQKGFLRSINTFSSQANPLYYEWAFMYALNGTLNYVLSNVENIELNDSKKNTLLAWAYFWKGFAYSRIASMYYAGIVAEEAGSTNNLYVRNVELLSLAEEYFVKADKLLSGLEVNVDYEKIIGSLIPSICQQGKGFPLSAPEWRRNINTLRARNILVNTPVSSITADQWNQISTLTSNGVRQLDNTFTIRTDDLGNLLTSYVARETIGPEDEGGGGYKISERLIQDFKTGDQRLSNNFKFVDTYITEEDRGTGLNTRYVLVDGGNGLPGVVVMGGRTVGAQELYIAGSYEENILMLAEANIYSGNVDAGLALIDELRNYQGVGLAAVAGAGLTSDEAKEELRRERRVGLAFRGFAFYDARRWGVLENGRPGCVVVDFGGNVHTNATIQYGYLDYWDVPIAESFYNPPADGSAPLVNPKN